MFKLFFQLRDYLFPQKTPLVQKSTYPEVGEVEPLFEVGTLIIGCSNEWENLIIGRLIGYQDQFELVADVVTNQTLMMMCPMEKYSPAQLASLLPLTPYERFNALSLNHKIQMKPVPGLTTPLWTEAQYHACLQKAGFIPL